MMRIFFNEHFTLKNNHFNPLKVKPDQKLYLLYLTDSISKNVRGNYIQIFEKAIVANFEDAFKANVRILLPLLPSQPFLLDKSRHQKEAVFPEKIVAGAVQRCDSQTPRPANSNGRSWLANNWSNSARIRA